MAVAYRMMNAPSAGEYEADPAEDLRPVCPNCHAVIHLGGKDRNIEKVRAMLLRPSGS